MNLREQAEADLAVTLEDTALFGMLVELIAPDGEVIAASGQVLYDSMETNDLGLTTIVHKPVVTLRRSSLSRIPLSTDRPRWACRIPESPLAGAAERTYLVETPNEGGGSIGMIRLYLTRAEQSVAP
jgi:hypothetical protein